MKSNRLYQLLLIFIFSITISSCNKEEPVTSDNKISTEALSVNRFIREYMNTYYLWSDEIPEKLDITSTENSKEFFNAFVYKGTSANYDKDLEANRDGDRWSFITDDLQGVLDYFNGET